MSLYSNLDARTLEVIEKYDKISEEYVRKTQKSGSPEDMKKLIGLLGEASRVLDIGCSGGRDCAEFSSQGVDIVGADLSENLLKIAQEKNPEISFCQADVRSLPFEDNSFDGVWAHGILHELPKEDFSVALAEIKRVLTPGGILFIRAKKGEKVSREKDLMSAGEVREIVYVQDAELKSMMTALEMENISFDVTKSKSRELYWISAFYRK